MLNASRQNSTSSVPSSPSDSGKKQQQQTSNPFPSDSTPSPSSPSSKPNNSNTVAPTSSPTSAQTQSTTPKPPPQPHQNPPTPTPTPTPTSNRTSSPLPSHPPARRAAPPAHPHPSFPSISPSFPYSPRSKPVGGTATEGGSTSPSSNQQQQQQQQQRPPLSPSPSQQGAQSSSSSFSSLFNKAKSSTPFLTARSALASASSYVATSASAAASSLIAADANNTNSSNSTAGTRDGAGAESNDKEKTWGEWAREWRDRRVMEGKAEERLEILPGWVVLVPRGRAVGAGGEGGEKDGDDIQPYDLQVATSGYAYSLRSPENATRSQRMFMRVAKSFAALPQLPLKIAHGEGLTAALTSSPLATPDLESDKDSEKTLGGGTVTPTSATDSNHSPISVTNSTQKLNYVPRQTGPTKDPRARVARSNTGMSTASTSSMSSMADSLRDISDDQLRAFHDNLDARLQPFWSSALSRRVQLSIYPIQVPLDVHGGNDSVGGMHKVPEPGPEDEPLMRNVFVTDAQGLFGQKIMIPWERIISHGPSLAMAFKEPPTFSPTTSTQDTAPAWGLYLKAELLSDGGVHRLPPTATAIPPTSSPSFSTPPSLTSPDPTPKPIELDADMWDPGANAFFSHAAVPLTRGSGGPGGGLMGLGTTAVVATAWTPIASLGGVRVISDLDDTVKVSNILSGAREVFRNAFCKPVEETAAEGMAELYRHLSTQGVAGFHYVSNSPYELLPVLQRFFRHHGFPQGFSLKLKYYGGRNLMNGLFEPPGDRKRPGIIDVMDSFPRAQFVLIGDSGEQDLELYVAVAKQRPKQVLAIAIRDVTTPFTAGLTQVNASTQAALRTPVRSATGSVTGSASRTPKREGSEVSSSDIDMNALNDALGDSSLEEKGSEKSDAEHPHKTESTHSARPPTVGHPRSGIHQAESSGIGGEARDVARKVLGADMGGDHLDVKKMDFGIDDLKSDAATAGTAASRYKDSVDSPAGSGASTPRQVPADPLARKPEDLEDAIAEIGAIGATTLPGDAASDSNFLQQEQQEIQALTAAQMKLVRRTAEWADRMKRARSGLPEGIALMFFQHPEEIEEEIVKMVKQGIEGQAASLS